VAKKRNAKSLYFSCVARAGEQSVLLAGHLYALEESETAQSVLMTLRSGEWKTMNVTGIVNALRCQVESARDPREYLILEQNRGLYRIQPPAGVQFGKIDSKRQGFLMDLKKIGKKWFAVGDHRQVYEGNGKNWQPIDQGAYIAGKKGDSKIFFSIDGFSESDLYAAGYNGEIFHYDGAIWNQLDSPTNLGLQKVLCVDKNVIYICGHANGLYRGNKSNWLALTEPDDETILWDMAYFRGQVYVCNGTDLFVIRQDALEKVAIPLDGPFSFYRMDADKDELWTCGGECLLQFDGKTWTRHIYPENK
jgi:hypothetical protein